MLYARPNRNGNTPSHFRNAARALLEAADKLEAAIVEARTNVTHGRNYQTVEVFGAQSFDVAQLNDIAAAVRATRALAGDIIENSKEEV